MVTSLVKHYSYGASSRSSVPLQIHLRSMRTACCWNAMRPQPQRRRPHRSEWLLNPVNSDLLSSTRSPASKIDGVVYVAYNKLNIIHILIVNYTTLNFTRHSASIYGVCSDHVTVKHLARSQYTAVDCCGLLWITCMVSVTRNFPRLLSTGPHILPESVHYSYLPASYSSQMTFMSSIKLRKEGIYVLELKMRLTGSWNMNEYENPTSEQEKYISHAFQFMIKSNAVLPYKAVRKPTIFDLVFIKEWNKHSIPTDLNIHIRRFRPSYEAKHTFVHMQR